MNPHDLLPFTDTALHTKTKALTEIQKDIADHTEAIVYYDGKIATYTHDREQSVTRLATLAETVPALEAAVADHVTPANTMRHAEKLLSHPAIHSLKLTGGLLVIALKPLFTTIKKTETGRKKVRRFIGCFQLKISSDHHVTIYNLSFPNLSRSHWAISRPNPCWGLWEPQVKAVIKSGHYDALVTLAVEFLKSTADEGAYCTARYWLEYERASVLMKHAPATPGEYYIIKALSDPYDSNNVPLSYLPVKHNEGDSFHFLAPVHCATHWLDGRPTDRDWYLSARELTPVTKEQVDQWTTEFPQLDDLRAACQRYVETHPPEPTVANRLDALTETEAVAQYDQLLNINK
jgi:hypothetical protein